MELGLVSTFDSYSGSPPFREERGAKNRDATKSLGARGCPLKSIFVTVRISGTLSFLL